MNHIRLSMKFYLVLIGVLIHESYSNVLPDYLPQCMKADADYLNCILRAVETAKPYLSKGIPELHVPPYDPFIIPELNIDRSVENLGLKVTLPKMEAHGGSSFKIEKLEINLDTLAVDLEVVVPTLKLVSGYEVSGMLFLIPLVGSGTFEGTFENCTSHVKGNANITMKNDTKYLQLDDFSMTIRVGDGSVKIFDDGQNRIKAGVAATFFNTFPRLSLDTINPIVEDVTTSMFIPIVHDILNVIPLRELIPDY